MNKISIKKHRIVAAPLTGIGWVAVQVWHDDAGEYRHVATYRSKDEAVSFIGSKDTLE